MTIKKARLLVLAGLFALAGCGSSLPPQLSDGQGQTPAQSDIPQVSGASLPATSPVQPSSSSSSSQPSHDGKYYLDDGPPDDARIAFADIPDAIPRKDKINPAHNRPYTALGKRFVPDTAPRPYRKRGMASWYGKRYHGRKTSTGEVYDMFAMTAAHPTLAIPSYARVTRVSTGESVVVRINDRGPFLGGRIIDLSFAAAGRLGFIKDGTTEVIVETILLSGDNTIPSPPVNNVAPVVAGAKLKLYVQFGAFSLLANAEKLRDEMSAKTSLATTIMEGDGFYRVVAGPYKERAKADIVRDDLCSDGWCGLVKELP